jgi:clan AA aspartic protease
VASRLRRIILITGTVNAQRDLIVRLRIQSLIGKALDVDVVIDTGFTAVMSMPPSWVANLGLPLHSQVPMKLADGTPVWVEVYNAVLIWDGTPQHIHVYAVGDHALLGTGLLVGHDLRARVEPGGAVEIEAIPP